MRNRRNTTAWQLGLLTSLAAASAAFGDGDGSSSFEVMVLAPDGTLAVDATVCGQARDGMVKVTDAASGMYHLDGSWKAEIAMVIEHPSRGVVRFTVPTPEDNGLLVVDLAGKIGGEPAAAAGVPANDECGGAISINVPSLTFGSTVGATADGAPFCDTSSDSPGVWYSVIGNGMEYTASLCPFSLGDFDTKLSVYCAGCEFLNCVVGDDDFCGLQSQVSWCADEGIEYLILVHGFGGQSGSFNLEVFAGSTCERTVDCVPPPPPPSNDLCDDAIAVDAGSTTAGTTTNATFDDVGDCGTSNTAPGVWYTVVGTGGVMSATTCSEATDYDTKLSVFCASCDEPICVGGNDDVGSCFNDLLSRVEWCSEAGTVYSILVHGFGSETGDFELILESHGGECEPPISCVPLGACCLCEGPDPVCTIGTVADCDALGGTYLGDDIGCELVTSNATSTPNLDIPDGDPIGVSDTRSVGASFPIADLNIELLIEHTWVGDLCVTLEKDGTTVVLVARPGEDTGEPCHEGAPFGCNRNNYLDILLDDEGTGGPIEDACNDNLTSLPNYVPFEPLSAFDGMDSAGDWTLTVSDNADVDTGTLVRWRLQFLAEGFPTACEGAVSCVSELESVDLAVLDDVTDERVFIRGFEDGRVEHKFYSPVEGTTPWTEVPNPNGGGFVLGEEELVSVEAISLDGGVLLYVRGFEDGTIEQNVYTPGLGWSGWTELPHEDDKAECEKDPTALGGGGGDDEVESLDVEPFNGLFGARVFVRSWSSGLIEQCIYTPQDGFSGWSEVPALDDLWGIAEGLDDTVESVQVTAEGGLFDRRIFVVGFEETRRVYQNIYTPQGGFSGWTRVRNFNQALGGESNLATVDVQVLGGGNVIYLRGRENGQVRQNIYSPQTGFTGWDRVTGAANPDDKELKSCSIEILSPGFFGERIFLRGFANGTVQQSYYSPASGQTRWQDLPGD